MIARFFVYLTGIPVFRTFFWKPVYNFMASRFPNHDWQMMNYGYHSNNAENKIKLHEKSIHQRYQLQMYHYLCENIGIKGKDVLEVGCGRGGGAHYLFTEHQPVTYHGIDIANKSIDFCKKNYNSSNLHFTVASAEKLPFIDNNFDVVINVESSHTYGSVPEFLKETYRVLRKNGKLLLADFRAPENIELFKKQMNDAGFRIVHDEDITANVVMALDYNHENMNKRIKNHVPFYLRLFFREFAAMKNTYFYNALKNRKRLYYRFVLEK